ncbi:MULTISPECIES: phospholipase [unclassified Streptomyces]|uniref:phospholipase n=1 Tax=unclassified Streptomyces TaxID=2593676 RepID=UPI002364FD42|nr:MULTISPECIES: phospholipase [unclassified Streptomyces]MDF3149055.1 phospholipase [Streptomyces sp. T21Q-yed]WDF35905.1 phospholipase [Streptomyces sp. T12]
MHRTLATGLAASALSLLTVVATAPAAQAAPADKPQVLASWTQTSASSYNAWVTARSHQSAWAAYGFDWSTDYCSSSPDNPFGFPFSTSCARHDFGYRNYKALGTFSANKSRIDSAFYEDLKRVCAGYSGASKSACNSTAWTYYQAVKAFG